LKNKNARLHQQKSHTWTIRDEEGVECPRRIVMPICKCSNAHYNSISVLSEGMGHRFEMKSNVKTIFYAHNDVLGHDCKNKMFKIDKVFAHQTRGACTNFRTATNSKIA